jgi:hypothetical protein
MTDEFKTWTDINIESGVSAKNGAPFCKLELILEDGTKAYGQMSPPEVRMMALHFMEVADAATSDAAVMSLLTQKLGLDLAYAAAMLRDLRDHRETVNRRLRGDE